MAESDGGPARPGWLEACGFFALVAAAGVLRLWGLGARGIYSPDEGLYCVEAYVWLARDPGTVFSHPAQPIWLGLLSFLLGDDVPGFLRSQALLGALGAAVAWLTVRRTLGPWAGLAAAGLWAVTPFLLRYQRSCLCDGNAFFFTWIALAYLVSALETDPEPTVGPAPADSAAPAPGAGAPRLPRPGALALVGLLHGIAVCFALPALAPAGFATLAAAAVVWRRTAGAPARARLAAPVLLVASTCVGGVLALFLLAALGYPALDWSSLLGWTTATVRIAATSVVSTSFVEFLLQFAGVPACLLALLGAAVAARDAARGRGRAADLIYAAVAVGLLLFLARLATRSVRIYLPLFLPVLWFAAGGVQAAATALAARCRTARRRAAAGVTVVAAFLALHTALLAPEIGRTLRLRGAFGQASDWLHEADAGWVLASQANFIFMAYGWNSQPVREELHALWRRGAPDREIGRFLEQRRAEGYSHLVFDPVFWMFASPDVLAGMRSFLDRYPPAVRFDHPPGRDPSELAEQSSEPARGDPRAGELRIYDLAELCAALAR